MKIFGLLKHLEIEIKLSGKVGEFCFGILGDTLLNTCLLGPTVSTEVLVVDCWAMIE